MIAMWQKGQAVLLPASVAMQLPHIMISPPASIEQRGRRNRNLLDLTYHGVNADAVDLAPMRAMQFGKALERLIREIFYSDPRFGLPFLYKDDCSDCFFRLPLNADGIPKLGSILPRRGRLQGRWKSDVMFRYLMVHATCAPLCRH